MRVIWLENRTLSLRELPVPEIPAGEALVRVTLAGICATDLELVKGYYPYTGIPGHEFVGVVEASPSAPELAGKRVVGEINAVCGACVTCLRGDRTHCENRTVLGIINRHGAFAEYLVLPCENLHVVPDGLADETAVFAEPLAAALEILAQVEVRPEAHVLLIGAGRLGQLIARVMAVSGCRLDVSARYEGQRRLLEHAGLSWIPSTDIAPGIYDIVIEATGSQEGFQEARRAVRPRGTIVLKSTYAGAITVNFSEIVVDEITLVGSRCGPFDEALRWLAGGRVAPSDLVQARYTLSEGLAAFAHAAQPGVLKVLLETGG